MEIIKTLDFSTWSPSVSSDDASVYTHALESGQLTLLPHLSFDLKDDEKHLLSPQWSDGKAKNISYDPLAREVRHTSAQGEDREAIGRMMGRFSEQARALVDSLFPAYGKGIRYGLTSFRPAEAAGRESSRKKDDTLIHVDAFASRPNQGERLLRVFSNVNPEGNAREWVIGEPFKDLAQRFLPRIPKPAPGFAWLLKTLGITRGLRSPYDHYMLQLHDLEKLDGHYQETCPKTAVSLPSGATWIVYTDSVPHAVKAGQFCLEQTFYLSVDAMQEPGLSPLKILEDLVGAKLV